MATLRIDETSVKTEAQVCSAVPSVSLSRWIAWEAIEAIAATVLRWPALVVDRCLSIFTLVAIHRDKNESIAVLNNLYNQYKSMTQPI
ncbi:hypothetical protein BG842_03020 [Haladaptatus sp. W1]|nr:hypothetical protein BG842_03020 [Haladaptatus sp. W1]